MKSGAVEGQSSRRNQQAEVTGVPSRVVLESPCHLQPSHFFITSNKSQDRIGVNSQTLEPHQLALKPGFGIFFSLLCSSVSSVS